MTNHTSAFLVIMDSLGGRDAGPQFRNEDLAFHAAQMAQDPGPGLLARVFGWAAKALAPRDVILGTRGMSAHMMRDMGLDVMPAQPHHAAPRNMAQERPAALGGRMAVSF